MFSRHYRIPYPTHKSPMDGDTVYRDLDWLAAARTDHVFALAAVPRGPVPRAAKLRLLETAFWPALARWVEARQEVLPGGTLVGGWWRADMLGMLDWYRDCLGLVPRWVDAAAARADGVWRDALLSSPWFHWPEFFHLLKEPVRDARGANVTEPLTGGVLFADRDPTADGMEDAFLDVWEAVANTRPLKKTARGDFILPHMLPPRREWKRIQRQRRELMAQEAAEIAPCASC